MKKEDVNIRNTRTWSKINDDGKAKLWRSRFIEEFGGEFTRNGRLWEWQELIEPAEPPKKKGWIVTTPKGRKYEIYNLSKYCRERNLDDGAMYRVLNGERKHHKGYKIKKGD
tara:strand:+ start:680 stop:1015 length:336 start_codon:yes stop_codon:yes gene_type:complete